MDITDSGNLLTMAMSVSLREKVLAGALQLNDGTNDLGLVAARLYLAELWTRVGFDQNPFPGLWAYDSVGGQSVGASAVTIALNQVGLNGDPQVYTPNVNGELTFDRAGIYSVSWSVTLRITNNSGTNSRAFLERDTGGGFVLVPGTYGHGYHVNSTIGYATISGCITAQVAAGTKIRIRAQSFAGGNALQTVANGSSLTVERIA
jgi:hypothetical protein